MKVPLIIALAVIAAVLAYHENEKGRSLWPPVAILSLTIILMVIL